jgi:glycosyltransferase involved in cell wall biosynthesis
MITVSVIIPTYNSAALVLGAAKSVLSQTLQEFELIIVDDGSTDNTMEVIAPLLVDQRIHYLYQENKGPPGARNAGAMASSGRYLAFLDADDFLAADALEVFVQRFDASGAAWANVSYLRLEGSARTLRKAEWPSGDAFLAILEDDFITRCPFFRRSEFFDLGTYDEKMPIREDWDINIRLIASGKPHICIEEPLYLYTQTEGSLTMGNRRRVHFYTEKLLQKHHKQLADKGNRAIAQIYARNMWVQARLHYYEYRNVRDTLRCLVESLRYDWSLRRLIHPLIHRFKVALGRQ